MDVNILNERQDEYEVGDLIRLYSGIYALIIKGLYDDGYTLVHVDGRIISCWYPTVEELLKGLPIKEHYKHDKLQISLKGE